MYLSVHGETPIPHSAAAALSELFVYNIPLRWSISHLYQAILDNEEHVSDIDYLTTLAGFIHWQITGQKVLGIGDASGMLPIDPATKNYSAGMIAKFDKLVAPKGYPWKLTDILPKVLPMRRECRVPYTRRCQEAGRVGPFKSRYTCLSSGRRCRNWHGSNQRCQATYRECISRHFLIFHDCVGKRVVQAIRND